jgi:uncharacterized protein with NAD-binding domain and iron-sulfur cluster
VSVHLWYDQPITKLPHVVLIDSIGQWLFSRGLTVPGEHYYQVVISAAHAVAEWGRERIAETIARELQSFFPDARSATLRRSKVIIEHTATFSAEAGIDQLRPTSTTHIPNLYLAGDWTQSGWPATMEGAVRSGYLAAEALLQQHGTPTACVQPDLSAELRLPDLARSQVS